MNRFSLVFVLASIAACGGKSAPATKSTDSAATAAADPTLDVCKKTFVKQRECTDVFIPALVDLRVRLDVPSGIAAQDKANGRDALVTEAKGEWANDSKDEAIAATCDKMMASMAPEMKTKMSEGATQCLAKSDCGEFVQCEMPMLEQHMKAPH
jgi:hypothetical protein